MSNPKYIEEELAVINENTRNFIRYLIRDFTKKILHGSDEHRAWLTCACELYINGKDIPKNDG